MTVPNTSKERVDALLAISAQLYPVLENKRGTEDTARLILREAVCIIAVVLRHGASPAHAGTAADQFIARELQQVRYGSYEAYRSQASRKPQSKESPLAIKQLANEYADTLRGTQLTNDTRESDAIHALHLTALAVPYARAHYPSLDSGKVALYCVLHDITEAITGDVPTFKISHADLQQKKKREAAALKTLRIRYGHEWPEFIAAIEAYESLADNEAAFVKSIDKNDPAYTHYHNRAHALRTIHQVHDADAYKKQTHANIQRTLSYAQLFPLVIEDKYELTSRVATFIKG